MKVFLNILIFELLKLFFEKCLRATTLALSIFALLANPNYCLTFEWRVPRVSFCLKVPYLQNKLKFDKYCTLNQPLVKYNRLSFIVFGRDFSFFIIKKTIKTNLKRAKFTQWTTKNLNHFSMKMPILLHV